MRVKREMKTVFHALIWALGLAALPAAVAAQQEPQNRDRGASSRDEGAGRDEQREAGEERRFHAELRLNALFFDNFFQSPEGQPQDDVDAYAAELRFVAPLAGALEAYAHLGHTAYEDPLEASSGATVGLRSNGRPHGFDLFAEYLRNRPAFDVGDGVEQADIARAAGEYSYRVTRDVQLIALADYQDQTFEVTRGRDNTFLDLGGAVRFRGFGTGFSPEIGATFGERDAVDPNEDHSQRDLYLKVRSAPVPPLYLSFRYRFRTRDYSVDSPLASNFEREDERQQIVATADLRTGEVLTWNFYYSYEDAESTLVTREFTAALLAAGLTIDLTDLFGL